MRLGKSHHWTPVTCPHCGAVMDGQAQIDGDSTPDEGSVAICIYCTNISVFGEGGASLRRPTEEEQVEFAANERLQYLRFAIAMSAGGGTMTSNNNTFTCEGCGGTFTKSRTDEDAEAEFRATFPKDAELSTEQRGIVCDQCYYLIRRYFQEHPEQLPDGQEPW